MKVALFGGSFNPPHIAHLFVCCSVLTQSNIDELWFMPCFEHAFNKSLISFKHRYKMCEIAAEVFDNRVKISKVEQELNKNGRTFYTLNHLQNKYPDYDFSLVIGSDILNETDKWYKFKEIKKNWKLIIIGRSDSLQHFDISENNLILPNISSSLIRKRIKKQLDVTTLVPKNVLKYIKQNKLYEDVSK